MCFIWLFHLLFDSILSLYCICFFVIGFYNPSIWILDALCPNHLTCDVDFTYLKVSTAMSYHVMLYVWFHWSFVYLYFFFCYYEFIRVFALCFCASYFDTTRHELKFFQLKFLNWSFFFLFIFSWMMQTMILCFCWGWNFYFWTF